MQESTDLNIAISKIRSGSFEVGREMLEKLAESQPGRTDVLYYLGLCYSELGLLDKAERVLEECVRRDPRHGDAYAALGTSLMQAQKYNEAAEKLQVALDFDPENFFALANLGAVYVELGLYDETIECLTRANRIMPDRPQVLLGLALAHELKGNVDRAEPFYRRVLATQRKGEPQKIARSALNRIEELRATEEVEQDVDLVLYCLDALRKYSTMRRTQIEVAAYEIASVVSDEVEDLDLELRQTQRIFELESLPGLFTGIQLLCYLYVGFRLIGEEAGLGEDLEEEYNAARFLHLQRYGEA